mmetsp:Transcript_5116/g.13062  ORF Transcript_5116/g.13062 Transcript_5116/m.13062 type:complete len:263 (+) Transcript_5116:179-967(+)
MKMHSITGRTRLATVALRHASFLSSAAPTQATSTMTRGRRFSTGRLASRFTGVSTRTRPTTCPSPTRWRRRDQEWSVCTLGVPILCPSTTTPRRTSSTTRVSSALYAPTRTQRPMSQRTRWHGRCSTSRSTATEKSLSSCSPMIRSAPSVAAWTPPPPTTTPPPTQGASASMPPSPSAPACWEPPLRALSLSSAPRSSVHGAVASRRTTGRSRFESYRSARALKWSCLARVSRAASTPRCRAAPLSIRRSMCRCAATRMRTT